MLIIMQLDILKNKVFRRNIEWILKDGRGLLKITMGGLLWNAISILKWTI